MDRTESVWAYFGGTVEKLSPKEIGFILPYSFSSKTPWTLDLVEIDIINSRFHVTIISPDFSYCCLINVGLNARNSEALGYCSISRHRCKWLDITHPPALENAANYKMTQSDGTFGMGLLDQLLFIEPLDDDNVL